MSKELNELMKPRISNEPGKYYVHGNAVFINELVIRKKFIARFVNENEAIMYASSRNKEVKETA